MSTTSTADAAAPSGTAIPDLAAVKPRATHVAFHVADIERAKAFYIGLLGMKERMTMPLGGSLHEVILAFPEGHGAGVILMWDTKQNAARELGNGYSRLVINVSDVVTAVQHLVKHDTPVVRPVTTAGAFKFALVKDPDGYVIELLQMVKA